MTTNRPFALSAGDDVVDSGEAEISASDVTPFLVLLGDGAGVTPPVPVCALVRLLNGETLLPERVCVLLLPSKITVPVPAV